MITLAGCNKQGNGAGKDGNVVAEVNGEPITYETFNKNFSIVKREYNKNYDETIWSQELNGKTFLQIKKEELLETLIVEELITQEAKDLEIKVDENKINDIYSNFQEGLADEDKKFYEENNIDEEFIKNRIKTELIVEEMITKITNNLGLDNEEKLQEIYEKYPVQVHAKHILIKDEKLAKEVLEKVNNDGDFTELAKEYSEDPSVVKNNGDLGYFPRGAMLPEFEEAAFSLNAGEISDLAKTEYGYHIIKVEDKKTIEDLKEEGKPENEIEAQKQMIINIYKQNKFIEEINNLKESAEIEKYEDNLN